MKKIVLGSILVIFSLFIIGCGRKEKTYEYLLDLFVTAYTKADVTLVSEIFPPYYVSYAKDFMTKEYLEKKVNEDKNKYGDDFTITYNVTKKSKLTDEEVEAINKKMASYFNTSEKASECYRYDGTITYKGSKKEDSASISSLKYCLYDEWYLVRN